MIRQNYITCPRDSNDYQSIWIKKLPILLYVLALGYLVCSYLLLFDFGIMVFILWLLVPFGACLYIMDGHPRSPHKLFFQIICPMLWAGFSMLSPFYPGDEYYFYGLGSHVGLWGFLLVRPDITSWTSSMIVMAAGIPVIALLGLSCVYLKTGVEDFLKLFILLFTLVMIVIVVNVERDGSLVGKHGSYLAYFFGIFDFALAWSLCLSIGVGAIRKIRLRGKWVRA